MKPLKHLTLLLSILSMTAACTKETVEIRPAFENPVEVNCTGGELSLGFEIINEGESGELSATTDPTWLTVGVSGNDVKINVDANTEKAARTADVNVSYRYGRKEKTYVINIIQEELQAAELKALFETPVKVSCAKKEMRLAYEIINGRKDGVLSAHADQEWLTADTEGNEILLKIGENIDSQSRESRVTVSYRYGNEEVTSSFQVIQEETKEMFRIEILSTGNYAVKGAVTPADDDMFYVVMAVEKMAFDSYGSEEAYIQDELNYFRAMADAFGQTILEVLDDVGEKGYSEVEIGGIYAGVECYFYVYGITYEEDPKPLTRIYKETFIIPE